VKNPEDPGMLPGLESYSTIHTHTNEFQGILDLQEKLCKNLSTFLVSRMTKYRQLGFFSIADDAPTKSFDGSILSSEPVTHHKEVFL